MKRECRTIFANIIHLFSFIYSGLIFMFETGFNYEAQLDI